MDGTPSDHNFLTFRYKLTHKHAFTWIWYKQRKVTDASEKAFSEELTQTVWDCNTNNNIRAANFHKKLHELSERHFPLRWKKKRSTDDPWIDDATRDMIQTRLELFYKEGRSYRWKKIKKTTNNMIHTRKKIYYEGEVEKLKAKGAD